MKVLITTIFFILVQSAYPCTKMYNPPTKFNPDEFIFIGKVVHHISAFKENSSDTSPYFGMLVELKDEIYLPEEPKNKFEVFPLALGPDCSDTRYDSSTIKKNYPIGSILRIVGGKSHIGLEIIDSSNIQIEVSISSHVRIAQNLTVTPILNSSSSSKYDYRYTNKQLRGDLKNHLIDSLKIGQNYQRYIVMGSINTLQDFELRKDLFRLHSLEDDADKIEVIERLKNFKDLGVAKLVKIILEYIESEGLRNKLFTRLLIIRENVDLSKLKRKS